MKKMIRDLNASKREDTKGKIRQKANERYSNPEYKEKHRQSIKAFYATHEHHTKGKHKSAEQKLNMSKARKSWCKNNPDKLKEVVEKSRLTNIERETHKNERNANWHSGVSKVKMLRHTSKELKDKIKQRDGYRCQQCFRFETELDESLVVHHIDFDKLNDDENNLITLCNSCHSQLSFDRENWIDYFKNVMLQRGLD